MLTIFFAASAAVRDSKPKRYEGTGKFKALKTVQKPLTSNLIYGIIKGKQPALRGKFRLISKKRRKRRDGQN